jgi:hypothetical protein
MSIEAKLLHIQAIQNLLAPYSCFYRVDLKATWWKRPNLQDRLHSSMIREKIEVGLVVICLKTLVIVDELQLFVRPQPPGAVMNESAGNSRKGGVLTDRQNHRRGELCFWEVPCRSSIALDPVWIRTGRWREQNDRRGNSSSETENRLVWLRASPWMYAITKNAPHLSIRSIFLEQHCTNF